MQGLGCQEVGVSKLMSSFVDLSGRLAEDVELGQSNVSDRIGVDGVG